MGDADRAELEQRLAHARVVLPKATVAWRAAITRDALAKVAAGDAPCPVNPPSHFMRVDAGEPVPAIDPEYDRIASLIERMEGRLADGELTRDDARLMSALAPQRTTVFLVDREDVPQVLDGGTFVSGTITGTAYMFDPERGNIVCTATIRAHNSKEIDLEYSYRQGDMLDREVKGGEASRSKLAYDLELNARAEISRELRAVQ